MLLRVLFDKVKEQRPTASAPDWPWTMKGPASEEQAFKARRGVPSPRLMGGKGPTGVSSLAALTS